MSEYEADYKVSKLCLGISSSTPLAVRDFYPSQQCFIYLWQIYLSNIHPITMIIHAPSIGEILAEAVRDHDHTTKDVEILLFAIMACALTSITDANCSQSLGEQRSVLFSRYRFACEAALMNANFLLSSNFGVLQAFMVYLVSLATQIKSCLLC